MNSTFDISAANMTWVAIAKIMVWNYLPIALFVGFVMLVIFLCMFLAAQ